MEELLQEHLDSGRLYEAHQVYRTRFSRKKNRKKYAEARDGAASGCLQLLERGEPDCATDLGKQIIEMYTEAGIQETPENLNPLVQIIRAYPEGSAGPQTTFGKAAVRWSASAGEFTEGSPELHNALATSLTSQGEFGMAQGHFLKGDQPEAFSQMLSAWSATGSRSESDLFTARAVLGYLVLKNVRDANILFAKMQQTVSEPTPLHNFLRYLLMCITRDAAPLYEELCKRYQKSLGRDNSFAHYIEVIGAMYFKIAKPQNPMQQMMQQMMGGMMG